MSSGPPGRLRVKVSTTVASDNDDQVTQLIQKFNFDDLLHVLYGKKQGNTVDLLQLQKERKKERAKTYCIVCHVDRPPNGCPFHEPSSTHTADQDDSLSYAIKSFPAEVQLCTSSVPGAIFGVCAKRVIPEGTWIGPYEGRRVSPEELSVSRDNPYVWEIYKDGQPSYYIDGSDESASSWMRFIRCARHKEEQNLYAFQYLGNIFYRSFKEIPRGTEMLVWYDEKYPQHLGIPTGLQEIEFISSSDIEKNSNGDKTSNTVVKSEGDLRHHVDKEKVKEIETNRPQKDYHTRLVVQPAESHQRVMATSSPHRLRHFSYPNTTRISRAPHSLSPSPGYLTHELSSLSSPGIPHATVAAPHYTRPHLPIIPSLQSTTPPSIYGLGYRHPLPVNISAGIPVSISGRGQLGITGTQLPRVHKEVMEEAGIPVSMSGRGQLGITGTQLPRVHQEVMEEGGIPVSMSGRGQLGITGTQLPRVHQEVLEEAGIPVSMSGRGQLGITGTQLPIVHQEVLEQSGIPVSMSGRGHLGITGTQLPRVHQEVLEQSGIPVSMSGRGQLGITGTQLPRVHHEVMEEGPVIISSNSVVYSDRHHRTTPSTSPVDNINTLDRDGSLQQKRVFYPSTTANLNVTDEVGQHNIVTLKRKATESTTIDPETRQYPPLIKRKSPITNIIEDSSLESEKGWSTRPRTPKERFTDDQGSERTRNTKSHRSHFVKEEHVSKSSRVTSAWPSDESQLQDDAAGESSDSNSTSSTKNEPTGIDEISMWRCRQCQKTFTQRVMLQVHVCPQQPLKPYRCGQCELSFATATELRSHVETHASEKPFKCGFCSRSFAGATTLNNHIRTHMGKRPFSCEHCGKSFAQAGQLARHQRTPGECETRTTKS